MRDRRYRDDAAMRYITRIGNSWRVLYVRGLEREIQLYFNDRDYGGQDKALESAKAFRDQVMSIHDPKPGTSRRRNLKYLHKDESQVGITLYSDERKGRKKEYYWRSSYMVGNGSKRRIFSIRKYGYEEAYRLASEFRHKMTGQPMGACPPPPEGLIEWQKTTGWSR